jgi:hypothetical protein
MSAAHALIDFDDTRGLLEADRDGLLRAAAMAGAQVRATAAAVDEGALDLVVGGSRPRTFTWVAGRGAANTAGLILAAVFGGVAGEPIVVASDSPPWIGPLDVMVVAGDDPGEPALVTAAATAVRRGARVIVVAPYEGPLRDATAGRSAVFEPRLPIPDEFGLCRYLAAGLATMSAVDAGVRTDLTLLADELDAEALGNGPGRELITNPAKNLAARMSDRQPVLAGDTASTLALARHAAVLFLRIAGRAVAAAGLSDALVGLRNTVTDRFADPVATLFHDEEFDGPVAERQRVVALVLAAERLAVTARLSGFDDVDVVGVGESGEPGQPPRVASTEQQLAILALRLEMAAVYLRLVRG